MKKTKTPGAVAKAPKPNLPSPEVLASIAAVVSGHFKLNSVSAVDYALVLWRLAKEKLKEEAEEGAGMKFYHEVMDKEYDEIEKPPKFPATLIHFLKLIVGARTRKDGTKRFHKFLRSNQKKAEADKQMAEFTKSGFKNREIWADAASNYLDWWKKKKSATASKNSRKK